MDAAADIVRRLTGLVFPESRRAALEQALLEATARARMPDLGVYLSRLTADPALLDELASEITVGESYFFRVPEQLEVVAETLFGDVGTRPAHRPLRFWSAGCAAGEEAYSLAILLHQRGLTGRVHSLATDISRAALAKARRGRYGRWSLRDVPEVVVRTYFRRIGEEFELLPTIRDTVEFRYLNLAEDTYPSLATGVWGMDLILCRNVLIYFDPDTVARVVCRLLDSLGEEGWLVLGPSDPLIAERAGCQAVITRAGILYRRARSHEPVSRRIEFVVPREVPAADRSVATPTPLPIVTAPPPRPAVSAAAGTATEGARTATRPPEKPADEHSPLAQAARCYAGRDYARAAEFAAEAARSPEADGTPWILLVRALANAGRLEDAGRACAAALERHETTAEVVYLHAVLVGEAGRHAEAAMAARRALYLDRGLVVAHLALGGALARLGKTDGARRAFRNAERLLAAMPPETLVPATDGEPAGRLAEMARVQARLLSEVAA